MILGVGLGILGVCYVLWKLLGQAQNIESAQRLLGLARKPSGSNTSPTSISTSGASSPVITGGNLAPAGDVVFGDQVAGDKHIHQAPTPRPELPTSHTPHNLPDRNTTPDRFVGREARLNELAKLLEPPGSRLLLTGMGGVGKSELALQYAYANLEHYRGGIVYLDALQGYEGMAAKLISFVRSTFPKFLPEEGPPEELVAHCWQHWPTAASDPEPVLLLLDDLPSDSQGLECETRLCEGLPVRFRRLITRREAASSEETGIDLKVLQRPDAMRLLRLRTDGHTNGPGRIDAEAAAADALCQEVGDLPLALVLLGARLHGQPDKKIATLLEDLKAKGAEASALLEAHPKLGAKKGVIESLLISWQPLSAPAKELAVLLSLMAPAVIPWELVEACRREEQELVEGSAFGDAQAELLRAQLLERVGPDRYRLHPLVRSFAALQASQPALAPAREVWRRQFAEAIATVCKKKFPQVMPLALQAEVEDLAPHIAQVAEHGSDALGEENLIWPCTALGRLYKNKANFATSLHWYRRGRDLCEERLGSEHPLTASSLNNLAALLQDTNRLAEAEPLMLRALAIAEASYGPDHPNVANRLNNLAQLLQATNRLAEAEPLMKRALAIDEASYGPDHPLVATSLNNLAQLLQDTNRLAEAEPLMQRALAILLAFSKQGHEHPHLRVIGRNYITLLQSMGLSEDAIQAKLKTLLSAD